MKIHSMQRLALYGGAFDPVHIAHVTIARHALEQAGVDAVIFLPSAQSPLKAHAPRTGDQERLEMLRLATSGESRFCVDTYEIERGGISYSVETVAHFQQKFPTVDLYWILGGDQFTQLHRWNRIKELARRVTFLVAARPGFDTGTPPVDGFRYQRIEAPLMPESSSEIRRLCAEGLSLKGTVAPSVEAFILSNNLYRW